MSPKQQTVWNWTFGIAGVGALAGWMATGDFPTGIVNAIIVLVIGAIVAALTE